MRGERMDTVGGPEVLKENSYIFFSFCKRYTQIDSRHWVNSKQDKHKFIQAEIYHN